jgi:hypothetical protein
VRAVARYLDVDPSFVYEHAAELGARRLGRGSKAALRFNLREVDQWGRSCSASRGSGEAAQRVVKPKPRRRRPASLGSGVELLPVKGAS